MALMKREEIEHLATLARIGITDAEADALAADVTSVLSYVSEIEEIASGEAKEKTVGPLHTVMRGDGEAHAADLYTDDLLAAAPDRDGRYIKVRKILEDKS
jgi:aspartyl-tRNA(Asn)/glutamyl-tRNA(Gln) amidotransferase subunit C